jgi:hypothetical protein
MQTNRINGEATIDLAQGREPARRIGLRRGGTPNHKMEAAAVEVGYNCLFRPNEEEAQEAMQWSIELLELQRDTGHMLGEVWTDSHSPIWLRAMTSLMLWVRRMQKARRLGQPVAGLAKLDRLGRLTERWFELHYASLQLGRVPRGPLAGRILLPCNRKSSHRELGVPGGVSARQADDMVRRVWCNMMTPPGKPGRVGRHYFTLSKDRQDTAAGPLTKLVLAEEGGFGANLRRGRLPKLIAPCVAELYEDGHHIYFPEGLPGSDKFSAPACWIEYDSGRFSFAGEPSPLRGSPVRIVRLARAEEPKAP